MHKEHRRRTHLERWVFTLFAATTLTFAVNLEAKKVYKWVDENGATHYGDRAPTDVGTAQEIRVQKTPAVDPSVNTRKERTERLLDSYETERSEKRETREAAAAEAEKREAQCLKAKQTQFKYQHAATLYKVDDAGERVNLTDEEYAETLAEAQAEVDKWCK